SSKAFSSSMSAPPLRCVRHESVFVFVVTFSPRDCLLRGNITSALLAAQPFGLNDSVEARERLMDGHSRVDELPEPVPDLCVVDAGGVFDVLVECFFDGLVHVPFGYCISPAHRVRVNGAYMWCSLSGAEAFARMCRVRVSGKWRGARPVVLWGLMKSRESAAPRRSRTRPAFSLRGTPSSVRASLPGWVKVLYLQTCSTR